MDDSKIIDLLFERSEQAIAELTSRYGPACLRIAEGILNNRQDAEECVNDTYLAVWNTVPPQKPDHLPGYVFRIVRNLALKKYHENTALKRNSSYDVALDEITEFLPGSASVEDDVAVKGSRKRSTTFWKHWTSKAASCSSDGTGTLIPSKNWRGCPAGAVITFQCGFRGSGKRSKSI